MSLFISSVIQYDSCLNQLYRCPVYKRINVLEFMLKILRPSLNTSYRIHSKVMTSKSKIAEEGSSTVELPEGVFYNPVQEFNRDLTVAVIRQFQKLHMQEWIQREEKKSKAHADRPVCPYGGINVLEALAASGLRSVRFCKEVPFINKIIANDLDENAVNLIKRNSVKNDVSARLEASNCNAVNLMHESSDITKRFHVVDIDPYGTASPFLDAAVKCLHNDGLLCVTSTDMAVLCGASVGTSFGKYGGLAIKCAAVHEQGLRILLHAIQSAASRHGLVIEPLLSLSIDFYARVYCRVRSSPLQVKGVAAKAAFLYSCIGCQTFHFQPLGLPPSQNHSILTPARGPPVGQNCTTCGQTFSVGGPMWYGPLHNADFVRGVLSSLTEREAIAHPDFPLAPGVSPDCDRPALGTEKRIIGMLTMALEELPDQPLYFLADHMYAVLKSQPIKSNELRSAFINAGYRISETHCQKNAIKTDAPWSFIWHVMRSVRRRTVTGTEERQSKSENDFAFHTRSRIMSGWADGLAEFGEVDFAINDKAKQPSKADGLLRFQINPPNWGPKSRARAPDEEISKDDSKRVKTP